MGVFSSTGVSIGVQDTLPRSRSDLEPITDQVISWTHTSASVGGYTNATAGLGASLSTIDEWLEVGLGRWITLYDEAGVIGWRGYVEQVNANIGGLQIQRGPLSGITNRCHMVYSTVDTSTTPPTVGVRATTAVTNNTASQAIYGIWQKALSCGGVSAADAAQLQALYLAENAQPPTTKTITPGGGNMSLSLILKGAWGWLAAYIANFTTTGTLNLSTRLAAILTASPNVVFSTDTSHIATNTYQVKAFQNDDKVAQKYVNELLTPGDATFNRYTTGFYDQEVLYYQPMPGYLDYSYILSDMSQEVTTLSGTVVRPWAVLPARWLQVRDLMIGRVPDSNLRSDPRNIFIEQVTYTAPYGLTLNGAKVGTLAQHMAQLGLSGIGG